MLTGTSEAVLRSRTPLLSSIHPNSQAFLYASALYSEPSAQGRILFIPLKKDEELEEFVYNAATACLVESYQRTQSRLQEYEDALLGFKEEVGALCLTMPFPVPHMGKKYHFVSVQSQWKVPTIEVAVSPAERSIKYELGTQFRDLIASPQNPQPATRERDQTTIKTIHARWQQFKERFRDVEALKKETSSAAGTLPNLGRMMSICEKTLSTGVLLFTIKGTFKTAFSDLLDSEGATGFIPVSEVIARNQSYTIQPVFNQQATHPLVLLHPPAPPFADWSEYLHRDQQSTAAGGTCGNGICFDTVVLDMSEGADRFDEQAGEQVAAIKEQLAAGYLRNVVCLLRPECFTELPQLQQKWQQSGRADIPVQTFQISECQANVLSQLPGLGTRPVLKEQSDPGSEQIRQQFRWLLDQLSNLMRDSYGPTQFSVLSMLKELYYRYISFYDPVAFRKDSALFLERLKELHYHVAGGLVDRIRKEAAALLDTILITSAPSALMAAARKAVLQHPALSAGKDGRIGVMSYNRNPQDQACFARHLQEAAASRKLRSLHTDFFTSRQRPEPLRNQKKKCDLLLVLNLPKDFAPLLHLERFAQHTLLLADPLTVRSYEIAARKVHTVYDRFITDKALTQVLNLPHDPTFTDGQPHFHELQLSQPATGQPLEEQAALLSVADEDGQDVESLFSRLLQEIKTKEKSLFPNLSARGPESALLLFDDDFVVEAPVGQQFYRLGPEGESGAEGKAEGEAGKTRAENLQAGDYIVLLSHSNRADLNELVDASLRDTAAYGSSLRTSFRWQQAIADINRIKLAHLSLAEVFLQAGFNRTQATFDNYLRGVITKPGDLPQLLQAINAVGRTLYPTRGLLSFSEKDIREIVAAVDQISHVRRMLPKALREAAIFRHKGRSLLQGVYGPQIRSELLDAILKEVSIRQIREVVILQKEAVCQ